MGRKQGKAAPSPRKTFSCLVVRPCWLPRSSEKPPSCTSLLFPLSGGEGLCSRGFGGESGFWLAGIAPELGVTPFRVWGGAAGAFFKGVVESSSSAENSRRPESAVSPRFCCHEFFSPSSYFFSLLLTHTPPPPC